MNEAWQQVPLVHDRPGRTCNTIHKYPCEVLDGSPKVWDANPTSESMPKGRKRKDTTVYIRVEATRPPINVALYNVAHTPKTYDSPGRGKGSRLDAGQKLCLPKRHIKPTKVADLGKYPNVNQDVRSTRRPGPTPPGDDPALYKNSWHAESLEPARRLVRVKLDTAGLRAAEAGHRPDDDAGDLTPTRPILALDGAGFQISGATRVVCRVCAGPLPERIEKERGRVYCSDDCKRARRNYRLWRRLNFSYSMQGDLDPGVYRVRSFGSTPLNPRSFSIVGSIIETKPQTEVVTEGCPAGKLEGLTEVLAPLLWASPEQNIADSLFGIIDTDFLLDM